MGSLTIFFGFGLLILQFGGNSILANGCSVGFISIGGVLGCFKVLQNEGKQTWDQANRLCKGMGLRLVNPKSDDSAKTLRKYLLDTHGDGTFWLDAKTDGTQYVWQHDNSILLNNDPLWIPETELPDKNEIGQCLTLSVHTVNYENHPLRPYGIGECSISDYAIICEESSTAMELSTQTNACPDCFTEFAGVKGCFKWSRNPPRNWFEAKTYCESINSHMGYSDSGSTSAAVTLRRDLLSTHGHATFWLGARAGLNFDVAEYVWDHDGTVLSSNNFRWFPKDLPDDVYSKYCLTLLADETKMTDHGSEPYGKADCRTAFHTTLCEAKVDKK